MRVQELNEAKNLDIPVFSRRALYLFTTERTIIGMLEYWESGEGLSQVALPDLFAFSPVLAERQRGSDDG